MTTTIRKNAFKKIESLLAGCEFIREFRYDDMGDTSREVTAAHCLATGKEFEFDRVTVSECGVVRLSIHGNWSFTAYPTKEIAARSLTKLACEKFGLPVEFAAA